MAIDMVDELLTDLEKTADSLAMEAEENKEDSEARELGEIVSKLAMGARTRRRMKKTEEPEKEEDEGDEEIDVDFPGEMPEGWGYNRGRQEIVCPHGVGHYAPWADRSTHGCDGCCADLEEPRHEEWDAALKAAKQIEKDRGRDIE